MMIQTVTERNYRILVAGALALISQSAFSGDTSQARSEPEIVTVTASRPSAEIFDARVETDIQAHIEAVNRRVASDQKDDLEAIRRPRIELVISEVPTRG